MSYQEAGLILKERRLSLNRELEQVSSDLKVSLGKLEALETGDVGFFGDILFYQLFYSTYARYLGLEIEEVQELKIPEKQFPQEKRKRRFKLPLVYTIVPIVVIVLISVFLSMKNSNPQPINGNQPPQIEEKPVNNNPIDNPPVQPVAKVVTVKLLVVKDKCWLQVNIDGNQTPVFRKTLFAGEEIEFKGENEVRLWIGNAGVLKIIVNGIEQPVIGKDGEVIRDLVFNPPD